MTVHFGARNALSVAALSAALFFASQVSSRAQATSPPNTPPAVAPVISPPAQPPMTCTSKSLPQEVGGAGLVVDAATGNQRKSWQPSGGEIAYNIRSFGDFDAKARARVCFRWKTELGHETYIPAEINRVELSSDARTLKIVLTIPNLPSTSEVSGLVRSLFVVPIAEVRILIQDSKSPAPVEVLTSIGITNPWLAGIAAIVIGVLAFIGLLMVVRNRLRQAGIPKVNAFLTVIATPGGYASLSQFQIVLWTFVVLMSAVYVMALSGDLIQITTGTLVLLGISGAATVGSKIHGESDSAGPAPAAPAPAASPAVPHDRPLWSDLITNVTSRGTLEIDVTRVQMLYFTLITAGFVAIRVFTTYVIPEIPDGFQILMGISNAVYMGSKVSQK